MRSAKLYAFRPSSKRYSTCEHLRGLDTRIEVALRNPRNRYSAAVTATDSVALQNLEEEFKQTSAARELIYYAIRADPTDQHSQTRGVRLAA